MIYLASGSAARKKLLRFFGFKFKVVPSNVRETVRGSKLSCARLVQDNALRKAREVAGKVRSGIIIAADTISVQDNRIFGKPRSMPEARRMLKKLSRSPQWVYSGIAVIDKEKNKTRTAYEKTRVYMDKLSDRDIDTYFSHVSPLDKAGAFDIQGKGAFFIRRIEGCFYNVVGLPLRSLFRILKDLGFFVFLIAVFLSGCSTEYNIATKKQEAYFYSTDKEVRMGESIARQVSRTYKLEEDPLLKQRVESIGRKIAAVCDRKDIDYHFYILQDKEINAVSLPGGYVYINSGLIEKVDNDDELAGVIAHEIGHIVARHSIKKLQAAMGYSVFRILVAAAPQSGGAGSAADIAFTELMLGYGREDELLADQLATRYMKRAGYDPHAMVTFLEKLQEDGRRKPLRPKSYFKTHPYVPDRIRVVKQEMGENIDFSDYINIEQEPAQ
ncbi:MAG: Maf family nucleotide pyrophosphatase [Candidatus Omnitrophota bacterium]